MFDLKDKKILLTGVCGTIGKELLRQLVEGGSAEIIGIDNSETELFFLGEMYADNTDVHLYLGDVRDLDALLLHTIGVDVVVHAAALKHVGICEKAPLEAVKANIHGTQNVIDAALKNGVGRVIFTSSDKAVNPTNVMGTTKLMGERLITAANSIQKKSNTIFASTRFGNVLGSRGSVVPLFKQQIRSHKQITLTDKRMTRFVMSTQEAVELVLRSVSLACGGEVFVTKMPIVRIEDLARVLVESITGDPNGAEIKIIGPKPGEKMYEELMSDEETRRTIELDRYFSVLPALGAVYKEVNYSYQDNCDLGIDKPYNSHFEQALTPDQIKAFLLDSGLLN
jgi:FlaA1/EpsC-like NDP-sugar epimerase